jgi:hypothetical protein
MQYHDEVVGSIIKKYTKRVIHKSSSMSIISEKKMKVCVRPNLSTILYVILKIHHVMKITKITLIPYEGNMAKIGKWVLTLESTTCSNSYKGIA